MEAIGLGIHGLGQGQRSCLQIRLVFNTPSLHLHSLLHLELKHQGARMFLPMDSHDPYIEKDLHHALFKWNGLSSPTSDFHSIPMLTQGDPSSTKPFRIGRPKDNCQHEWRTTSGPWHVCPCIHSPSMHPTRVCPSNSSLDHPSHWGRMGRTWKHTNGQPTRMDKTDGEAMSKAEAIEACAEEQRASRPHRCEEKERNKGAKTRADGSVVDRRLQWN